MHLLVKDFELLLLACSRTTYTHIPPWLTVRTRSTCTCTLTTPPLYGHRGASTAADSRRWSCGKEVTWPQYSHPPHTWNNNKDNHSERKITR